MVINMQLSASLRDKVFWYDLRKENADWAYKQYKQKLARFNKLIVKIKAIKG